MANAQEPEPTAAPEQQVDNTASFAIAAALTIGLAAAAGALAMGIAISKSSESISRQPEADEKIRGSLASYSLKQPLSMHWLLQY